MLSEVRRAIRMIRGVASVKKSRKTVNKTTRAAIEAADRGETFHCDTFDDYLKLVNSI